MPKSNTTIDEFCYTYEERTSATQAGAPLSILSRTLYKVVLSLELYAHPGENKNGPSLYERGLE
ncbi:MAG: hypothetical protein PHR78_04155 [Eubacteriales bacterium]|nr:hypothetical protein [Eubacteriales bacterium]MDD4324065.1 hypothetical protein [Eubacteriales bacterium]MDD4541341.1 hypothetical protein [Eubacteriales bacterium]